MDKDYESLLENYEDAAMRLVMYRIAQEDGKCLLEEAEQLDALSFEVPKELDEKCLRLIREVSIQRAHGQILDEDSPNKKTPRHFFHLRMAGRILVAAILAAVLLFGVAYAANEEFRVNVLNFFLEIQENGTQFFFHSGKTGEDSPKASSPGQEFSVEFTYIPEGYKLVMRERQDLGEIGTRYFLRYSDPNDDNNNFFFCVGPISEGTGLFVDTEAAAVSDVIINGYDGQLIRKIDPISKKDFCIYLWFDLENGLTYRYSSLGILPYKSQEIFEAIVLNGEKVYIA